MNTLQFDVQPRSSPHHLFDASKSLMPFKFHKRNHAVERTRQPLIIAPRAIACRQATRGGLGALLKIENAHEETTHSLQI